MTRSAILGLAFTMAGAAIASAQPVDGIYVGLGAGINYEQPYSRTDSIPSIGFAGPKVKNRFDVGFVGVGSVGYGFGNGFRAEIEGNVRENHGQSQKFPGGFTQNTSGFLQTYGAMANVLFDFDIGSPYVFPYAGVGAGYAWTDYSSNDTSGRFAAQGIAGSSFPIPGVPGLSLTAEYRFFGMFGADTQNVTFDLGDGTTAPGTIRRGQRFNHSGLLGLRYAFDVPPPPAEPLAETSPVAAPSRNYLIFFDWDRATLTARARTIVKEAADNVAKASVTRIEVNGYTDTSGTPKYNQGLSIRRADAVAAELVRDGVAKSEIAIQGFGETKLLVPTAAGVREPQNRRVEIILR